MQNRFGRATGVLALLWPAACGGGGGAVATAPASQSAAPVVATSGVSLNLQPANMAVSYDAASAMTDLIFGGGRAEATSASGQGAKVTLSTDASGNLSKFAFNIPLMGGDVFKLQLPVLTGDLSLSDPRNIDLSYNGYSLWLILGDADGVAYKLSQVAGSQALSFSVYGFWTGSIPNGPAGGFAIGNMTPAASVPTAGTATFNGSTVGVGGAASTGVTDLLQGNVQILANFSAATVTTNLTGLKTLQSRPGSGSVIAPLPDLTGSSALGGNAYAGAISGGGLSGTINGNFYGPAAQETAGVWQASGNGTIWVGGYGAK